MSAKKRAEGVPYEIGQWNGLTQYKCHRCAFDTLNEAELQKHIEERHTPKPMTVPVEAPILDRFGNLITEREVK